MNDDVDALYRVPLGEFTAARNGLAKRLGSAGADIKGLEKPSVPAWAVNQLYWRHRPVYNRLVQSAERLRAEHRKLLAGKPSKPRDAEKLHREAIRAATDQVRAILTDARQALSPATITAVGETLEALPTADAPGRLTKALRPMGFEALAGLRMPPSAFPLRLVTRPVEPAKLAAKPDAKQAAKEAAAARRKAESARKEAAKDKERRRLAEAELRRAEAAVERAEAAFATAEREAEQRRDQRDAAREALRKLRRAT